MKLPQLIVFILFFSLFVGSNHGLSQSTFVTQIENIAILGDSLGTGAATHPKMVFDNVKLWEIFDGKETIEPNVHGDRLKKYNISDSPELPSILRKGTREYYGAANWVVFNLLQIFSEKFLNVEQYSWGYMVGRALGVAPKNILFAAENGARISSIARQSDRVMDYLEGGLPEKVVILYSGNDLCAINPEQVTGKKDYRDSLEYGLRYMIRNGRPHENGTEIIVVGFVGVLQLLGQDEILNKKVMAFGEEVTCRQLREGGYLPNAKRALEPGMPLEALYLSNLIPPNPARMCPTLFGHPKKVKEHLSTYANRIRSFRTIASDVVDMMNLEKDKEKIQGISFRYVDQTKEIVFKKDDIAGDCFHLTIKGQTKIADAILTNLAK